MKKSTIWAAGAVVALVLGGFGTVSAQQTQACLTGSVASSNACPNQTIPRDPTNPYQVRPYSHVKKVLLYDIGSHPEGKQSWRRSLIRTAYRYGFELVITDQQLGYITATTLAGVDVVVFSQGDGDRVPSEVSATALQNYIYRDGKAMLMVHAAAAFITCPGTGTQGGGANIEDPSCKFMARAVARQYYHHVTAGTPARVYGDSVLAGQVPPYASLGATGGLGPVPPLAVISHGRMNPESKNIFNNNLMFNWALPPNSPTDSRTYVWDNMPDEWYDYYNSPGPRAIPAFDRVWDGVTYNESRLNILISLDETSVNFGSNRMGDHPESWVRKMGNGLAGYNNMGHDSKPFTNIRTGDGRNTVDSAATKYSWNLIRFLARDYVGCTDSTYQEWNPDASVEALTPIDTMGAVAPFNPEKGRRSPCLNKISTGVNFIKGRTVMPGIRTAGGMIQIPTSENGSYKVVVTNALGKQMFARSVNGGAGMMLTVPGLSKGTYFVRVNTPRTGEAVAKVSLN